MSHKPQANVRDVVICPNNSTVDGYSASWYWPHLRFKDGIARDDNPLLMAITGKHEPDRDVHISVPLAVPGDKHMKSADLGRCRVRPKLGQGDTYRRKIIKSVQVARRGGVWHWRYEFD